MRRAFLLAPLVCAAAVAPGYFLLRQESSAGAEKESGKSATASLLPIAQVVLFSSGVGYFQREGTVDGNQRIDLSFPVADINDLIKSMTLRDLGGGRVG